MTRIQHLRLPALIALLAISSLRCSDNKIDPDPIATTIEMFDGDDQSGPAGLPLAEPLVVLVTDDEGDPVSGVSVSWTAQGGGSVSSPSVTTGSDGRASVQRVLGPAAGQQTATASVSGLEGSPVLFTSTALVEAEPGLVITTNPPVSALTSEVFAPQAQPVVVLRDGSGNPVSDAEVTASIASGTGTLEGTVTATTDANGVAAFGDLGISGTGEHTIEFTSGEASVTSSPVALTALPPEATTGKWGPIIPWDIVPLHMNLLPNGKVFAWGKRERNAGGSVTDTMGVPRIWDPATGPPSGLAPIAVTDMLFCAGHILMPDGRLMVNGGHHMDDAGIKTNYFFSQDGAPTKGVDMANGRWYPTLTILPNGNVLTMAGRNQAGDVVTTPELWNGSTWSQLTGAGSLEIPYYPRNFVDPKDGRVFYAGERIMSRWFNVAGAGSWSTGPEHIWRFNRDYGTAVMYDTGKILYAGGGGHTSWPTPDARSATPTATAERIDLNQVSPTWQSAGSMSAPRRHLNSTVLPDGQVLVTGGTRGGGFVNITEGLAVKEAEIWNPNTDEWTTLAANQVMRVYHSVSMLMPDGTVLHGASGDAMAGTVEVPPEPNHEIFSPPYLFKGNRPTITSAPANVSYAGTIAVTTPNAAQITEARWIRLGSVTHAFDMGQRANKLSFTRSATGVVVNVPDSPNVAPPGYYLLFILNRNGVPSTGAVVKVG